jgi:hypothetical protein
MRTMKLLGIKARPEMVIYRTVSELTWIARISLIALSRIGDVLRDFVDVLHGLRIACGILLVRHYCNDLV